MDQGFLPLGPGGGCSEWHHNGGKVLVKGTFRSEQLVKSISAKSRSPRSATGRMSSPSDKNSFFFPTKRRAGTYPTLRWVSSVRNVQGKPWQFRPKVQDV